MSCSERNVLAEYLRNIVLKELTKKTVKNRQKTVRSGSVRVNFGPKFSEPKIQFSKTFNLCGHRRRGGGPLAAFPTTFSGSAPAAAATAAQIEMFCKKVGGRLDLGVGLRFPEPRGSVSIERRV